MYWTHRWGNRQNSSALETSGAPEPATEDSHEAIPLALAFRPRPLANTLCRLGPEQLAIAADPRGRAVRTRHRHRRRTAARIRTGFGTARTEHRRRKPPGRRSERPRPASSPRRKPTAPQSWSTRPPTPSLQRSTRTSAMTRRRTSQPLCPSASCRTSWWFRGRADSRPLPTSSPQPRRRRAE